MFLWKILNKKIFPVKRLWCFRRRRWTGTASSSTKKFYGNLKETTLGWAFRPTIPWTPCRSTRRLPSDTSQYSIPCLWYLILIRFSLLNKISVFIAVFPDKDWQFFILENYFLSPAKTLITVISSLDQLCCALSPEIITWMIKKEKKREILHFVFCIVIFPRDKWHIESSWSELTVKEKRLIINVSIVLYTAALKTNPSLHRKYWD